MLKKNYRIETNYTIRGQIINYIRTSFISSFFFFFITTIINARKNFNKIALMLAREARNHVRIVKRNSGGEVVLHEDTVGKFCNRPTTVGLLVTCLLTGLLTLRRRIEYPRWILLP